MVVKSAGPGAPNPGVVAIAAIGVLFVAWLFSQGRPFLHELLVLAGAVALVLVVGRAGWRWWLHRHQALSGTSLLLAFRTAAAGWLVVALVLALSKTPSDNFIWILLWPFLMLVGFVAGMAGLAGVCLGSAVAITAAGEPHGRRLLYMAGGPIAAAFNLGHIYRLVRLLLTG